MFNNTDVKLMSSCITAYKAQVREQKEALTIGTEDCTKLMEFYDNRMVDCDILQSKVNGLLLEPQFTEGNKAHKKNR